MDAEQLKQFMAHYQLDVEDISRITMVTKDSVYKWLSGKRKMSALTNRVLLESRK